MFSEIKFRLTGVAPLLMHNVQLANPSNEFAIAMKAISKKRNKTEKDFEEMSKTEWYGGLYVNDKKQPIVPSLCLEATMVSGAKKDKNGTLFKSSVFCFEDVVLEHDGPKDIDKLFENKKYKFICPVTIGRSKVMRTRPMFPTWSVDATFSYLPEIVNRKEVIAAITQAGVLTGLLDWRPRFGRFDVEIL